MAISTPASDPEKYIEVNGQKITDARNVLSVFFEQLKATKLFKELDAVSRVEQVLRNSVLTDRLIAYVREKLLRLKSYPSSERDLHVSVGPHGPPCGDNVLLALEKIRGLSRAVHAIAEDQWGSLERAKIPITVLLSPLMTDSRRKLIADNASCVLSTDPEALLSMDEEVLAKKLGAVPAQLREAISMGECYSLSDAHLNAMATLSIEDLGILRSVERTPGSFTPQFLFNVASLPSGSLATLVGRGAENQGNRGQLVAMLERKSEFWFAAMRSFPQRLLQRYKWLAVDNDAVIKCGVMCKIIAGGLLIDMDLVGDVTTLTAKLNGEEVSERARIVDAMHEDLSFSAATCVEIFRADEYFPTIRAVCGLVMNSCGGDDGGVLYSFSGLEQMLRARVPQEQILGALGFGQSPFQIDDVAEFIA